MLNLKFWHYIKTQNKRIIIRFFSLCITINLVLRYCVLHTTFHPIFEIFRVELVRIQRRVLSLYKIKIINFSKWQSNVQPLRLKINASTVPLSPTLTTAPTITQPRYIILYLHHVI